MFKKLTLGVLGLALVAGILFGGNLVPYVTTGIKKARDAAKSQVPISFQIDAAKEQLDKIDPEIEQMVYQIAKEKAQITRLENELAENRTSLTTSHDQMMTLRNHLSSGEEFYTAANAAVYTNQRVREDLAHRFELYKTAQQTVTSQEQVLAARKSAVDSALDRLDEARALQHELEVKIENLRARDRVNQVAKTASQIDMDNSELARTASMIDDISAQIEADSELLQLAPKYFGQIPVTSDDIVDNTDILKQMDDYFGDSAANEVVTK